MQVPLVLVALLSAAALSAAIAALALLSRTRHEFQQARNHWAEQSVDRDHREQQFQQRLLELGERVIALERRLNRALEQQLLQRARIDPDEPGDSEQARQLRAASRASSPSPEADAEARLRALLAQRGGT